MLVLGIDPGTAVSGFGLVTNDPPADGGRQTPSAQNRRADPTRLRLVECGVIRTHARAPLADRLHEIHAGVTALISRHRPDVLVVEGAFHARNARTTLALGHARGVILLAGVEAGLAIREYPPAEIKKAVVGHGAATKEQVQFMLSRLLRLQAAPQPADAADGVAAAVAYFLSLHTERFADMRGNGRTAAPAPSNRAATAGKRTG